MSSTGPITITGQGLASQHSHGYPGSFNGMSYMNTAIYWGQGANQERLRHYCEDDGIDIVNLAFLNIFPDQSGGYPGTNFGNACGSQTFKNKDGSGSPLLSHCPYIGPDIKFCQNKGKTVLLSLGGAYPNDQYIESHHSAVKFADFLWNAFGPEDVKSDVPRPFGDAVVDGFDFDIESVLTPTKNEHQGYGTMIDTLRTNFASDLSKTYYISGAPQCIIPDAHLAGAIETSWFDFLFVQFYNTPECSARAYFDHSYGGVDTDISFDSWVNFAQTKALNKNVKIYLGLPAASDIPNDSAMYLSPEEATEILEHFQCKYPDQFGGAMVYEATSSDENRHNGESYVDVCKNALKHNDPKQCATKHHSRHRSHDSSFPSPISSPSANITFPSIIPSGGFIPTGLLPSGSGIFPVYPIGTGVPSGTFPSGIPTGVFLSGSVIPSGIFPSGSVIPSGAFPSGLVLPSGSVLPSGTDSPSSSGPSNPSSTAPSNTGFVSSMPTIPSSSQSLYPITNSSRPATTISQSQASENSSPTITGGPETIISTVSETDVLNVTSCGPEVTNCPAKSHPVTTAFPVSIITQAPQTTEEVVVTGIVTSYMTTCPYAHTITSAGQQVVQTGITTSTVFETITSTICTKCLAPQKTAAPASSSHNQSPAQGSSNGGSSHSGSQGSNNPSNSGSQGSKSLSNSGPQGSSSPSNSGSNAPGAMGHSAANVQSTPAQPPAEQGSPAGQSQGQSPAQYPAEQGQSQGRPSPAESGSNEIASTVAFVPVETITIVPVPKYPYQTAQASTASGSGVAAPSGTVSAGAVAGAGSSQHVEEFKGAASRMGAGVFGIVVAVMAAIALL